MAGFASMKRDGELALQFHCGPLRSLAAFILRIRGGGAGRDTSDDAKLQGTN